AHAERRVVLERIVEDAEALADASPLPSHKAWKEVERRWEAPEHEAAHREEVEDRFTGARDRLHRRRAETKEHRANAEGENWTRLEALWGRLRDHAGAEDLKVAVGRRDLQAAETALADLGPLPGSERRAVWTERLSVARDELLRRVAQAEQT